MPKVHADPNPQVDPTLRFFLGVQMRIRPNWQSFFSEPQAPARYGAEAAEKFRREKRAAQEENAGHMPFSAYIQRAIVIDGNGSPQLSVVCDPDNTVRASSALIQFASGTLGTTVATEVLYDPGLDPRFDVQVRWFGFDIRDVMQMAALEVMHANGLTANPLCKTRVPAGFWYFRHFTPAPYIDPYETLVPSNMREHVDVAALCEFMGITVPPTLGEDAQAKAELARQLVVRGQFWHVPDEML